MPLKISKCKKTQYKTEADVPIGGVYKNAYGSVFWKTLWGPIEEPVVVMLSTVTRKPSTGYNVRKPMADLGVYEYCGTLEEFVEIKVNPKGE